MAESVGSILEGSDDMLDHYCEPCFAASDKMKPVAGHCKNCDENLCKECFTSHRGLKLFMSHKLVKGSPRPNIQPTTKNMINNKVIECMPTVALIIVAIIFTSILNFHTQEMAKLVKNFEDSKDVRNLRDIVNDVKKLRDNLVDMMSKTEKQADIVKREDFTKIERIIMEQNNKLTEQLETLKENNKIESLLIAMKYAQNQLQSLEEKLDKQDKDKTVKKLKAILEKKRPANVKDITVTDSSDKPSTLFGSLVLPNKQILILDGENKKLKLIDTDKDKIISEIQLSGRPFDITKVNANEVAVTVNNPDMIKFISVSQNVLAKVRKVAVDRECTGIVYNDRDQTLIVAFVKPPKVKILDMAGTEIRCIEYDSAGDKLFKIPLGVALTPDMKNIYVTDHEKNSVTLLSLNGDIEAVYKDKTLSHPVGVYLHTSGLVFVVGLMSETVHKLDPENGEFMVILEKKDGLVAPLSISYGEKEDKMYIGMAESRVLKEFQMK